MQYNTTCTQQILLILGQEFFIGITKWTNELGACAVASTFPEYPCTPIKVSGFFYSIT